jgi:hypothetical protein
VAELGAVDWKKVPPTVQNPRITSRKCAAPQLCPTSRLIRRKPLDSMLRRMIEGESLRVDKIFLQPR